MAAATATATTTATSEGGDGCSESRNVLGLPINDLKPYKSRYRPARKISYTKKERIDEIEDRLFRNEDFKEQSLEFANAALCHLNSKADSAFELVKPGLVEGALISRGSIFHINFKAKWEDDPDEPVETLFAQIRLMGDGPNDLTMFIDCCVNLGPTNELPEEVYDGGCQYCSSLVYHPIGGCKKLLRGCVNDEVSWLHRKINRGHLRPSWYKYTERLRHSEVVVDLGAIQMFEMKIFGSSQDDV